MSPQVAETLRSLDGASGALSPEAIQAGIALPVTQGSVYVAPVVPGSVVLSRQDQLDPSRSNWSWGFSRSVASVAFRVWRRLFHRWRR